MAVQTHTITEMIKRVLALALLTLSLLSIHFAGLTDAQPNPDAPSTEARQMIQAWLECGTCTDKEVQDVKNLGNNAVPSFKAALIDGPSAGDLGLKRVQLRTFHERINARELGPGRSALSENQKKSIEVSVDNYVAFYKIRAAQALGAIATNQAKQALEMGKAQRNPKDVDQAIDEALKKIH